MDLSSGLVAHWPFAEDCADHSAFRHASAVHNVNIVGGGPPGSSGAALFDGQASHIEVAPNAALDFGTGDFAIALWIHTEEEMTDVVGDVVSKYDPEKRKGFNLSVVSHSGVTSSMSNDRNVQFGIDDGRIEPGWRDCGRPGRAVLVTSLLVHEGALYAATMEPGEGEAGHVYRYEGEGRWFDCGAPAACNAVHALVVHQGEIYCGVTRYRTAGSCLPDSPNENPGGKVFRYEGGRSWTECGSLDEGDGVHCLVSFNGTLYGAPIYDHGVFAWRGGRNWEPVGPDARVMSLGFWNGHLYALASGVQARVYRMDPEGRWADLGHPPETRQIYSFAVHRGRPYIGTWPQGDIFRYDGETTWARVGSPGYSKETMGMAVYNGKLYAGVLPMAQVYRYDGGELWTLTGTVDNTPDVPLRRAWSMAVYDGRLYCGTLPSGRVLSIEAGRVATLDRRLPSGWHHLAAVRRGGRLLVALDGRTVAESSSFWPGDFNVTSEQPLRIGFGPHDHLNARVCDLRIYNRALSQEEIVALAGLEEQR